MAGHSMATIEGIKPIGSCITPEAARIGIPDVGEFKASRLPGGGFSCDFCSVFMRNKSDMRRHILTHTRERLFQCSICGKGFIQKGNLKVHIGTVHKDVMY